VNVDAQPLRELITNREIQVKFSVVVAIAIILFVLWRADAATLFLAASAESLSRWIGLFQVEPGCVVPARIPKRVWRYFMTYARILTAQSWIQHFSEHLDVALMRALAGPAEFGAMLK
jgi:hypothetical protein